jgi:hypothetical protein
MSLERILAEEAELEKQMFGTNQESEDTSSAAPLEDPDDSYVEDDNQGKVDFPEATEVILQETQETETEAKQRVSWKTRFKNFKASTDKTISTLRKENSRLATESLGLRKQVDELSTRVASLQSSNTDIFSGIITDEDSEAIGEEAVDIVKRTSQKAVEASVAPLKEKLRQLEAEKEAERLRKIELREKQEYNYFLKDLEKIVPDYEVIDHNPKFLEFMDEIDPSTGDKRMDTFKSAESYRDADRVADFFLEFKRTLPRSKRERLEENITPTGTSGAGDVISNVKPEEGFTATEVEKFFNDVTRGVYRNRKKEANDIENRITKAYMEGRIR